jgi:hypothetical protein
MRGPLNAVPAARRLFWCVVNESLTQSLRRLSDLFGRVLSAIPARRCEPGDFLSHAVLTADAVAGPYSPIISLVVSSIWGAGKVVAVNVVLSAEEPRRRNIQGFLIFVS